MLLAVLALLAGAVAICGSAEVLVRGGSRLALAFRVPSAIVGLTVVAYGTSAPEAVVSSMSVLRGAGDIAVGNVLGSNVANIGLILGVSSLMQPLRVERHVARSDLPVVLLVSLGLIGLAFDGTLDRADGIVLILGALLYTGWCLLRAVHASRSALRSVEPAEGPRFGDFARVLLGLVGLALGANLLVNGAVTIARAVGIGELVIGATVVAVGTSLPELAASAVASLRGDHGLSMGNAVGSNIFNILLVLGLTATIAPLSVTREALVWDAAPGIGLTVALMLMATLRGEIGRWQGLALVAAFVTYITTCVLRQTLGWV
jgi:cation:H+ antiporter